MGRYETTPKPKHSRYTGEIEGVSLYEDAPPPVTAEPEPEPETETETSEQDVPTPAPAAESALDVSALARRAIDLHKRTRTTLVDELGQDVEDDSTKADLVVAILLAEHD